VGEIEGLDDLVDLEQEATQKNRAIVEDTVERPVIAGSQEAGEDLLSSTSITRIIGPEDFAKAADEQDAVVIDLSDSTGVLPRLDEGKLEVTGLMPKPEFGLDAEAATMSEVGTKLDLARAYIDMGDPEGARSILDEVLKEGSQNQRKEAERLLAGLP
jgi:pilus assembly protein FimV